MIRLAAAGSDASTAKVSEWMTGRPRHGRPRRRSARRVREPGRARLPAHPGRRGRRRTREARRDRVDARPHARRDDPAGRAPRRTRCRRASKASSSPRPTVGDVRGLEGFYHYRQYSAVDLAETRPLEDVWHLLFEGALPTTRRSARRSPADVAAAGARSRPRSPDVLPEIARGRRDVPPLDVLRTAVSRCSARPRLPAVARHRRARRCATTRCRRARSSPR